MLNFLNISLMLCSGAFGSHVSCVMRRLVRLCLHYGAHPQFIFSSATIANPFEHAMRLVPMQFLSTRVDQSSHEIVEIISKFDDGAPTGERYFYILLPRIPFNRLQKIE
jgi:DEAD/DEAH box helicase domain-containing protein